jgi:prephenate dehydrogenase
LSKFLSEKLVVIGVGLIGGSVACALRRAGCVRRVVGVGRSLPNMRRALELGVIDEAAEDLAAAVKGADTIVLAVPVRQNDAILAQLGAHAEASALITDTGSTKADFALAAARLLPGRLAMVVPGHPIAGAELTGVEAASADLFAGKNVVLTPLAENPESSIERAQALWLSCGARVSRMSPAHHDRVFSAVSHLPHMLAYALITGWPRGRMRMSCSARRRVPGAHPHRRARMWRDIALARCRRDIAAHAQSSAAGRTDPRGTSAA